MFKYKPETKKYLKWGLAVMILLPVIVIGYKSLALQYEEKSRMAHDPVNGNAYIASAHPDSTITEDLYFWGYIGFILFLLPLFLFGQLRDWSKNSQSPDYLQHTKYSRRYIIIGSIIGFTPALIFLLYTLITKSLCEYCGYPYLPALFLIEWIRPMRLFTTYPITVKETFFAFQILVLSGFINYTVPFLIIGKAKDYLKRR